MDELKTNDPRPAMRIVDGLVLVAHITGYLIGSLIVIGGFGFWLDSVVGGRKIVFLVFAFFALVVGNLLVIRKAKEITKRFR
jgi:F0F1-type ATP synthase assembly protein I